MPLRCIATLVVVLAIPLAGSAQTSPFVSQDAVLLPGAASSGSQFGSTVVIDGDTALVGGSSGTAVFVRHGGIWNQQAMLPASSALALSGNTALVAGSGGTYVFVRAGTTWSQQAVLATGLAVAIDGDTAVVGDWSYSGLTGLAYVYVRSGTSWTQQAQLVASDAQGSDEFGMSVDVQADTIAIGADGVDANGGTINYAGSIYIFERTGTTWSEQAKLFAADPQAGKQLGQAVVFSGSTLLAGAPGGGTPGAVYVFVREGAQWTQQAKLTQPDGQSGDWFGFGIGFSGDVAVVGAFTDDTASGADSGSAYEFVRSGSAWSFIAKFDAADTSSNDYFGTSVSLSGNTALLGAPGSDHGALTTAGIGYTFKLANVAAWADLGQGMPGLMGIPQLTPGGVLIPEAFVSLTLANAKPFTVAPLVVGLSNISAPFKGGVMVPSLNFTFPLFTDFFGSCSLSAPWPVGIPPGFTIYFQWWIQDSAGAKGFAASNAVAGTAP